MSMTTLQAQLAALNGSSGKHAGSLVASSRRQEDALGRGLHFRPQLGHAVTETIKYKASFVYATAEEAAKVPLRILQDNAQEAAGNLAGAEPSFADDLQALFGSADASNATIKSVLIHLSTFLGEKDDAIVENCLHVLEYLLRRYKVHLSADLWQDLIWCFLPHHKERASLLHRCLQLVDLAGSANQSYLFLRPYSDPKNPVAIPRALISQHVMRNGNLLRHVCSMVQEATSWIEMEDAENENETSLRYGLGYYFSWTAACIVEGLAWQRTARNISDAERENVLRVLIPIVRHTCASTHDARAWGYIVASATAETMELGDSVLAVWTTTILEYANDQAQAWTAVLSILMPPQTSANHVDEDCFLPLIQGKWLGCPLQQETFLVAIQNKQIPQILGYLDQELQVAPLVAAFVVKSIKNQNYMLLLDMLREPTLASLWAQEGLDLLASTASWIATYAISKEGSRDEFVDVLKEFHKANPTATEEGFAHAMQQQMSMMMDEDEESKESMVRLLEEVISIPMDEDSPVVPPRVALDHTDRQLRLGAISSLASSENQDAAELLETFVRRWAVEDDFQVLEALADAISDLIHSQDDKHLNTSLILKGLYRTLELGPNKSDKNVLAALRMLRVASPASSKVTLYEASLGFLLSTNKKIAKEAKELACEYLGLPVTTDKGQLTSNLLENAMPFLIHIQESVIRGSKNQATSGRNIIEKQCAHNILKMLAQHEKSIATGKQAHFVLELAASCVSISDSKSNKEQLLKCLKDIAPLLSSNEFRGSSIVTLGVLPDNAFQLIGVPALESLLESSKESPVSILFETALNSDFPVLLRNRLLILAADYTKKYSSPLNTLPGVIPALMMLEDDETVIRSSALSFLVGMSKHFAKSDVEWSDCDTMSMLEKFFQEISVLEGVRGLEPLVTLLPRLASSQGVQKGLMHLCKLTARLDTHLAIDLLPADQSPLTLNALANFLGVLDLVGNESFSLLDRWETFGLSFVETICKTKSPHSIESYKEIMERVVKMMRGRFIAHSQSSSGPRKGGGRTRSYSLGDVDGVQTVAEYPEGMKTSILSILKSRTSGGIELTSVILRRLFMDDAWSRNILHKMDTISRVEAFKAVSVLVEEDCCDDATSLFLKLPFEKIDVQNYLDDCLSAKHTSLSSLISASRFILDNVEKLAKSDTDNQLLDKLFASLIAIFESRDKYEKDNYEYTCHSLLSALDQLCLNATLPSSPTPVVTSSFQLLLRLQGRHSGSLLASSKYRLNGLSLTTVIADKYPEKGLSCLSSCFEAAMSDNIFRALGPKHSFALLKKVFTVFWKHNTDDQFTQVLKTVAQECPIKEDRKLLADVVQSLSSVTIEFLQNESCLFSSVGSLMSVSVALGWSDQEGQEMALQAVQSAPKLSKMPALVLVSTYMKNLIVTLTGHIGVEEDIPSPLPSHMEIASLATQTKVQESALVKSGETRLDILRFLLVLAGVLHKSLQTSDVHRLIRKGTGNEAKSCLSLWQTSLWLHAVTQQHDTSLTAEKKLWNSLAQQLGEIRDEMQSTMPLTLFIASVSAMLDENPGSKALTEALDLVSERVTNIHSSSVEAALFLSLVPSLEKSIGAANVWSGSSTESCQTTLMTIENIGRVLFLSNDPKETSKNTYDVLEPFVAVLKRIEHLLDEGSPKFNPKSAPLDSVAPTHRDLLCCISLAVATITKMIGQKALPHIPKILKPLLNVLSLANAEVQSQVSDDKGSETNRVQLSVVRAIFAMAESVPSSLGPHLRILLSETILFSPGLREQDDHALQKEVSQLDIAIATKIPGRLLVPSLLASVNNVSSNSRISLYLSILLHSIENMTSREAATMRNSVFTCVTKSLEVSSKLALDKSVLHHARDVVVTLVLKLSEGQLRNFYTSLRDWKNSSTPEPQESNASRREAFWFISTSLSEKLRSLFLPCLSSVVDDVSSELQHGASVLSKKSIDKGGSGRKKRKLAAPEDPPYEGCARIQSYVLLTLERSLQADARSGGNWVRVEEGNRYNMILEPVAKLFHSDLQSGTVDENNNPNYENFVEGLGNFEGGSVTGCLTALAVAAGDEQLWKPLNHAVLEAAGTEGRSEVRLAGLNCLLGLIKSLGEEYMVLLPECLPVLSELLEDSNEEVAGVARDIISMAEDLLGESLEDTLR